MAKKYWSSGAELMDLLSKEEIVVTDAWSGRIAALQQQGHPIGYLDPAGQLCLDGGHADPQGLADGRMRGADQLHARSGDRDRGGRRAELSALARSQQGEARPTRSPKLPAFDPTGTMKALTFADPIYWATNDDAWTKQWDRISKGA